jgi:hypothetical protein
MVYDIQSFGDKEVGLDTPRPDRRRMIEQILQHLPKDQFHISESADSPEAARELWQKIREGKHQLTAEGAILWPQAGKPMKGKLTEDSDVYITGTFPGEGKYKDRGIGGFTYANTPGGPTVGRVGTGLTDTLRSEVHTSPEAYAGRVARIRSQEQLPSGAYRAPALIAFHEDLPEAKTASVLNPPPCGVMFGELVELGIIKSAKRFFLGEALNQRLNTPFQSSGNTMADMANYLQSIPQMANQRIRLAHGADRMKGFYDPQYRYEQTLRMLEGQPDEIVTNPYDRVLQAFPALGG